MVDVIVVTDEDLHETALTIIGEADNQPTPGKIMVAWVIRTRATWDELESGHPEHEWWGTSPARVCLHPYQFACRNLGTPLANRLLAMPLTDMRYQMALGIAKQVFAGTLSDPTAGLVGPDRSVGGATHYKVAGTTAEWDAAAAPLPLVRVGAHQAWRLGPQA